MTVIDPKYLGLPSLEETPSKAIAPKPVAAADQADFHKALNRHSESKAIEQPAPGASGETTPDETEELSVENVYKEIILPSIVKNFIAYGKKPEIENE